MIFKPNPLMYGVNEGFCSAFRLSSAMCDPVDVGVLAQSVATAMDRYPYFAIRPVRQGEQLVLEANPAPVPVFPDGRTVLLGSEESSGHLLSFACEDRKIYLDCSHYLADGMGIIPFLKTVLHLYSSAMYGDEGLDSAGIRMPGDPVPEGEYEYPFQIPSDDPGLKLPLRNAPELAHSLDPDAFDHGGLYAYHLHVPQKEMMAKAGTADGSPVSFLTVMLHRAVRKADPDSDLPVVAHVQHQYRSALQTPLSHHSLVNYIPVVFPPRCKDWPIEKQNTAVRGQVILRSEKSADLAAVQRLLDAFPEGEGVRFAEKQQAMERYAQDSIEGKTFGISYVGRLNWGGLGQYLQDFHAYIGEKQSRSMLLVEVLDIGEDFSLTFMQSGRGERYLQAFVEQLGECGIPGRLVSEGRYSLCDTKAVE